MTVLTAATFIFLGLGGLMLVAVVAIRGHREMRELNQRIKELNDRLNGSVGDEK
jgi:hypothetical protein